MNVQLKHVGCSPALNQHYYFGFADSGWSGLYADEVFVVDGTYDLPDDMFSLDSDEYQWQCDACEHIFTARSRPGGKITCPLCGEIGEIPEC